MKAAIGPRLMADARVGQKNKITRRWAKRGTRPSARTTSARSPPTSSARYYLESITPAMERIAGRDAAGWRQLKCRERPRGSGGQTSGDRAQRKMPIPAVPSQVPAARVLRFRDSAGTE
jgi:hypothetical protein